MFPDGTTGGALLVGSVPLASARRCSARSPGRSATACAASPTARPARARTGSSGSCRSSRRGRSSRSCRPGRDSWRPLPRVRLADGAAPSACTFEALGYADAARASYRTFARLKRDGVVPVACRFQVCLPTPLAPISAFVVPEHQAALEPVYEARLLRELGRILEEMPHDQLAIQWDTNFEFGMLEGVFPVWFADVKGGHPRAAAAPRPPRARRRRSSATTSATATCSTATSRSRPTPASWSRSPTRWRRASAARSTGSTCPCRASASTRRTTRRCGELRLRAETELYLGLVHHTDGVEGTRRRMDAAAALRSGFGVATECGWGRRPPADHRPSSCASTRAVSAPIATAGGPRRAVRVAGRLRARARRGLDAAAGGHLRPRATTPSRTTAGTATSTRPSRTSPRHLGTATSSSTTRAAPASCSTGSSCGSSTARSALLIVDSSPKFLRVALDKFGDEERVALPAAALAQGGGAPRAPRRGARARAARPRRDAIASTNAIHLYRDLPTACSRASRRSAGGRR